MRINFFAMPLLAVISAATDLKSQQKSESALYLSQIEDSL